MNKHSESKPPLALGFSWLYAPVLAAIYPVLQLYAVSAREVDPSDAAICGLIAAVAAISLAYLLRLVYSDAKRAGCAAVVLVVWCFTFSGYLQLGRIAAEAALSISSSMSSPIIDLILTLIWLVLLFVALWFLYRAKWSEYRIGRMYRFVTLACLFALFFTVYQVARGHLQSTDVDTPASIWSSDREGFRILGYRAAPRILRDVYYLIFDRYGNDTALRRFFQFDNSQFYNELEKRGFIVYRNATTSYPMTMPSMSSTLNMRYLSSRVGTIPDYELPSKQTKSANCSSMLAINTTILEINMNHCDAAASHSGT